MPFEGFTRRGFLKALGIGAAGTAVASVPTESGAVPEPIVEPVVDDVFRDIEEDPDLTPSGYTVGQKVIVENANGKRREVWCKQFDLQETREAIPWGEEFGCQQFIPGPYKATVFLTTFDPMSIDDVKLVVPIGDIEYHVPIEVAHMNIIGALDDVNVYVVEARALGKVVRMSGGVDLDPPPPPLPPAPEVDDDELPDLDDGIVEDYDDFDW